MASPKLGGAAMTHPQHLHERELRPGIYNRSTYAAEEREALERWGAHVAAITTETLSR